MSRDYYLGMISGTSMDAVDCVLVEITDGLPCVVAKHAGVIPDDLKHKLTLLCSNRDIDLQTLGIADIEVGRAFATTALELMEGQGLDAKDICAIGSHGQTIWHHPPRAHGDTAFSIQIGDPNTIAERTGVTTIADFRRRDMAAGGQGAPIVPVLHQALFQSDKVDRIVLNLGGIANITVLPKDGSSPIGLDTGPASVLMDAWISLHQQRPYDPAGAWAASAVADPELLQLLLDEPYFRRKAPKSTGRELFNLPWLESKLLQLPAPPSPAVVQATLLELTTQSIAREIEQTVATGEIIVCGGGSHNTALMQRLVERLPGFSIDVTTNRGLDADYVEATAFAWFAYRTLRRIPTSFHPFTGAKHAVVAGGIYYA